MRDARTASYVMTDPRALALAPVVSAAASGSRDAFTRLVDETKGLVSAITLAITRDVQASEDVAQDVYLDAWKGMAKLHNPTSFLPWLRQLARNKARLAIRSNVRRRRHATLEITEAVLETAVDPAPDALETIVAREERAALAAALDTLPAAAREVLVLYYREGGSVRQTAELLGIGEDAVKQRLARARARVRDQLLDNAGRTLAKTTPGTAFVAAVTMAVSAAAPGAATAAGLGMSQTTTGGSLLAKAGAGGLTAGAAAGFLSGLLGGLAAILAGSRTLYNRARDEEERRGVRVYTAAAASLIVAFLATMVAAPRPLPVTIAFLAAFAGYAWLSFAYVPRITARRRAAELREDPGAAVRHARARRGAVVGCVLGFVLGAVPIVWLWLR